MNRNLLSALVLVMALGLFAGAALGEHSYPRVAEFFTGQVSLDQCDTLSKWDVLVLNHRIPQARPEVLTRLRALNPDIKLLVYYPVGIVWADCSPADTLAALFASKVEDAGWSIFDTKGNRVGDPARQWFLNTSCKSPEDAEGRRIHDWLAEFIADRVLAGDHWDGVFLDGLSADLWWLNNRENMFRDPPAMLDLDQDGVADECDSVLVWAYSGIQSFLDNLRQRVGDSCILVGNAKRSFPDRLNGAMRENFPYMHGDWEANMLSSYGYLTLDHQMQDTPMRCMMILCQWRNESNTIYEPYRTPAYERFMRYTLSSALLGDGYYFLKGDSMEIWWEDYYDLDLGAPESDAYVDSVWNTVYHRYSPVWRRDFENAAVYCNPYDEYIGFDDGWLNPQDGLIVTHAVPLAATVDIVSRTREDRKFDQSARAFFYEFSIGNTSANSFFASVWADLSKDGTTLATSIPIEYLVGAEGSLVGTRRLRLPSNLSLGSYCLTVRVGSRDGVEASRDTLTVTKVISFDKEKHKGPGDGHDPILRVSPQPALLGGEIGVEFRSGEGPGAVYSFYMYDVAGRLVRKVFERTVQGEASFMLPLDREGGGPLAPGVYFICAQTDGRTLTRKVIVLRR